MISGLGISSGIASAVRTAGKARATMDDMSRQIATGQRVSSVKDDGAAWARAAGLKSEKAAVAGRETLMAAFAVVDANQTARTIQSDELQQKLIELVTSAMAHPAGSQARQAIGAEYDQVFAAWSAARAPDNPVTGETTIAPYVWGVQGTAADPLMNSVRVHSLGHRSWFDNAHHTIDYLANGVPIGSIDVRNGSAANLTNGLASLKDHLFRVVPNHTGYGNTGKSLDWARRMSDEQGDRLDAAIGSFTDADLGQASTNLRQAETRQQLALSTVRQALDAYGAYAGGLLGNVQRTQRAIA
jgi:flagellin-like hook-associated protein FlgL